VGVVEQSSLTTPTVRFQHLRDLAGSAGRCVVLWLL